MITYEESERTRRTLERRIKDARLGRFKALADYDWKWPNKIDKTAVDDLFKLSFFEDGANSMLLGPNGVGKTMLLKNLAHHCVNAGRPHQGIGQRVPTARVLKGRTDREGVGAWRPSP